MSDIFSQKITNHFTSQLDADSSDKNVSRQVYNSFYSYVKTKTPSNPELLHISKEFVNELGVTIEDKNEFTNIMSGAKTFKDSKSYAMCYGGHQFGNWAGQLGDGRATNIFELDIKKVNWKFQLKGAGPTPYSRSADGFAVLRSSVREYLCSEAMHYLGVPTTRAISLVKTGDKVSRDVLYNGNPKDEHGAIVCRVSPSFIRFGSFEIFSYREDYESLKKLLDFTLSQHYSHLGSPSKETYIKFFKEVCEKTKEMILHWQRVGFVHGVMNTDNMSILGLTIDYGPYGWLENYDPNWTPNTTDEYGKRYRYKTQFQIALWNLAQLGTALYPPIEEIKPLETILHDSQDEYEREYHEMMSHKLGLYECKNVPSDFIAKLEQSLHHSQIDMTIFFRELSSKTYDSFDGFWQIIEKSSYIEQNELNAEADIWKSFYETFSSLVKKENFEKKDREKKMKQINPKYVLRNYMAHIATQNIEDGKTDILDELYTLLLKPYDEQPDMEKWYVKRPDWAKDKVGCSMLSCSS